MRATAEFYCDRAELRKIEAFTESFARDAGLAASELFALQIVVEELVTNVIDYSGVPHGEYAVTVELSADSKELVIRLTDCGCAYNPLLNEVPNTALAAVDRPVGGLGVHFCRKLTDVQEYERISDCNVLTLKKNRMERE